MSLKSLEWLTMIFEIRDYHYEPERLDTYRVWAAECAEYFMREYDLVGFWMDSGTPATIQGSDPMDLPHGAANVTWILRWADLGRREIAWEALWENEEWLEIWDRHPGFDGYLHMSVRFMTAV